MKEEEEVESGSSKRDPGKIKKKKRTSHIHIGPNVRAYRVGRAFCPVCDAEESTRRPGARDRKKTSVAVAEEA